MFVFGVILVRIFPHSNWIWRDTESECGKMRTRITPNTESLRILSECGKMRIGITPNTDTVHAVSKFYDIMSSHFFAPYILQPTRLSKNSRTLIDNISLNSIEFKTFSGNLASIISDHLPQLLILKDFYRKSIVTNSIVYERNYQLFNDNKFKNDLKSMTWEIIVSSQPVSSICFTNKLIHC